MEYLPAIVPIIMGSESDLPLAEKISSELTKYHVGSDIRICSAHKSAVVLLDMLSIYESSERVLTYITIAGKSNALSALIDGHVSVPVISCPPLTDAKMYDLYSSTSMPSYIAPMVVLNAKNSALAAAKICGLRNVTVRNSIKNLHEKNKLVLRIADVKQKYNIRDDLLLSAISANLNSSREPDTKLSKFKYAGKVRDMYELVDNQGNSLNKLEMFATDKLSAFDKPITSIPYKGVIINKVSAWWFNKTQHICPNHFLTSNENLSVVKKCTVFPIEFVVRAYMTGSTKTSIWYHYQNLFPQGQTEFCGNVLPKGLVKNQRLPRVLVTPTTKGEVDESISGIEIVKQGIMTQEEWEYCKDKALQLFEFGQKEMSNKGLILVDTKYEFGRDVETGEILLVDEVHTPDSSRYWFKHTYDDNFAKGKDPDNIDKEFIRKWIKKECENNNIDVYNDPLPTVTNEMVSETSKRYMQLYDLITGKTYMHF